MALSASGGGTQNLYLSKGIQFAHRSRADGDFGVRKRQIVDGTHVNAWEQRVVNQFETGCTGVGRPFVTLLARGPWVMDNHTAEVIGADNFTADWDLDGAIFNSAYKYIVATGSATDGSNTSAHDWTSDGSDGVLPRGFQKVTSFGSGEDVRISQIVRAANTAMETETFNLSSKWEQTGDPNSYAINVSAGDMTADDVISVARAFLVEQGSSIALDSSVLEDFRDDIKTPDTLTMTTGTAKTDADGDYNTDGFNERHGWYEVTCDSGDIDLTLNVPVSGTRFHPVFRLWSYTAGASPTVTIAGSGASAGTDYLIDDLGDGTAILQVLSDRTADTDITLTGVDTSKPTVQSASINTAGALYTIVYDEPVTGQTGHTLSATGGAVTLTPSSGDTTNTHVWSLDRTILKTETVTRSYSPGNAQDAAGNTLDAYSGQAVTNGSGMPRPTVSTAAIDVAGDELSLMFPENVTGQLGWILTATDGAVTATGDHGDGTESHSFSLSRVIGSHEVVTLAYDSATGNAVDDDGLEVADFSGLAVTNNSTVDTTAPEVTAFAIGTNGTAVTITYDKNVLGQTGFTLTATGGAVTISAASGNGTTSHVFTASRTIGSHETVTAAYDSATGNALNEYGTELEDFSGLAVTNGSTQDTLAPTLVAAQIIDSGDTLQLVFSENVTGQTGFSLTASGGAVTLSAPSGDTTETHTFALSRTIADNETVTLDYDSGTGTSQDDAGNVLATITDRPVSIGSGAEKMLLLGVG
jgi:hypothetical protein